jgi:hypothetical protein
MPGTPVRSVLNYRDFSWLRLKSTSCETTNSVSDINEIRTASRGRKTTKAAPIAALAARQRRALASPGTGAIDPTRTRLRIVELQLCCGKPALRLIE